MLVTVIPLLGCHVFESVAIDCVKGQPCARPAGGDADTDADADTDTDTDVDTGPIVLPTKGFVVSLDADGDAADRVRVYDPSGVMLASLDTDGAGPVAWDAANSVALLGVGSSLEQVSDAGTSTLDAFTPIVDVEVAGGLVWTADADNVTSWDVGAASSTPSFTSDPGTVTAIGPGGEGVFASIVGDDGAPDLFDVSVGLAVEESLQFDTTGARARAVFAGPDGEAYTCSGAGAIYRVASLAEGSREPAVFYDGGFSDVTDCGWDEGDGSWLVVSPTAGVLRLDAEGRATTLLAPPSGYAIARGNFY